MSDGKIGGAYVDVGARLDKLQDDLRQALKLSKRAAQEMEKELAQVDFGSTRRVPPANNKPSENKNPLNELERGIKSVASELGGLGRVLAALKLVGAASGLAGLNNLRAGSQGTMVDFARNAARFGGDAQNQLGLAMKAVNAVGREFTTRSHGELMETASKLMKEGFAPGAKLHMALMASFGGKTMGLDMDQTAQIMGAARRGQLTPDMARDVGIPGVGPGDRASAQLAKTMAFFRNRALQQERLEESGLSGAFNKLWAGIKGLGFNVGVGAMAADKGGDIMNDIAGMERRAILDGTGLNPAILQQRGGAPNITPGMNDFRGGNANSSEDFMRRHLEKIEENTRRPEGVGTPKAEPTPQAPMG